MSVHTLRYSNSQSAHESDVSMGQLTNLTVKASTLLTEILFQLWCIRLIGGAALDSKIQYFYQDLNSDI